jgi:hypothetical protein
MRDWKQYRDNAIRLGWHVERSVICGRNRWDLVKPSGYRYMIVGLAKDEAGAWQQALYHPHMPALATADTPAGDGSA